jgi:cytoskeletal protein CcmA (bactofilin family)
MYKIASVKGFSFPTVAGFNNRRGNAFLTAMFFLVILLGLGTVFVETSIQEVARASRVRKETRALSLAEGGLDYAVWRIYNENPTSFPTTYSRTGLPEGEFSAVVSRHYDESGAMVPNSLEIISTGTSQGWQAEVKAIGQYMTTTTNNNSVFDHALFSDSDIYLGGTADIVGDIHSNGNISLSGTPSVDGDGSASGWIKDKKGGITGTKTQYAPKIPMPVVDVQYYRSIATTIYSSSQTFSGTTTLDGVIFVDGDMHISGQVDGDGVFVATGTIHVDGNVTLANADSSFALISTKKIKINGSAEIEGVLYAHNAETPATIDGNGTATITGAVVADLITTNGTLLVTYHTSDQDLPGSESSPIQVDVVSWRRVK